MTPSGGYHDWCHRRTKTTRNKFGTKTVKAANGSGSITWNKTSRRWVGRLTVKDPLTGKSKRMSFYGKVGDEHEAGVRAKLVGALHARDEGQLQASNGRSPTLGKWVETWLTMVRVRPKTKNTYASNLAHAVEHLGTVPLTELSVAHINSLLGTLHEKEGLSSRSCNHVLANLRNCLRGALEYEHLTHLQRNVAKDARPIPPDWNGDEEDEDDDLEVLDADEVRVLLEAAHGHRDEGLWIVALATGMRQSELIGLTWGQVDLEKKQIRVTRTLQRVDGVWLVQPPKTKKSRRIIPVADVAVEALAKLQEATTGQPKDVVAGGVKCGDLVFREPDGSPLVGVNATKRFQYLLHKAELPQRRFHDLRGTACTFLALAGVPVATAQAVMGHSSATLTLNIYSKVNPALAREAAEAMNAVIAG